MNPESDAFRRTKIISLNSLLLEELLSGRARCVNWPKDGFLRRSIFDISRDCWLVQLVSAEFSETPAYQPFPEFDLVFEKNS